MLDSWFCKKPASEFEKRLRPREARCPRCACAPGNWSRLVGQDYYTLRSVRTIFWLSNIGPGSIIGSIPGERKKHHHLQKTAVISGFFD